MSAKELALPIQGGVVAAQQWKPTGQPTRNVLFLHGWQDNSNSFRPLIELLPKDWWMVAIDFPGHGYSTPRPPGAAYYVTDWIADVRNVVQKLGWKKFSIVGHSMGAGVAQVYAALFPDQVEAVVSLDVVKQISDPGANTVNVLRNAVNTLTNQDGVRDNDVYTPKPNETFSSKEEALNWLADNNKQFMSRESAAIILERGLRHHEDKGLYEIRRDIRLTFPPVFRVPLDQHRAILKELKCDMLIIKAARAQNWESADIENEFLDMYKTNCRRFVHEKIDGLHHLHLDNPSAVAPLIQQFLEQATA